MRSSTNAARFNTESLTKELFLSITEVKTVSTHSTIKGSENSSELPQRLYSKEVTRANLRNSMWK